MRGRRLLGFAAVAVAAIVTLAGCAFIPAALGLSHVSASGSAPQVGQCWNATDHEADEWSDWEGLAASSCSQAHVLYTYEVGSIKGISAKSWAASGDASAPSSAVEAKAETACTLKTLLPKLRWNQELVEQFFFIPTEAQWAQGARWVRCDVGVLAFGTTLADEDLARLPSNIQTLVSSVVSDPKRYEFCIDSPVPASEAGPLDSQAGLIADCTNDPQWALAGHGNLPEAVGSPFPSGATANADTAAICSRYAKGSNETWIAYLPAETKSHTVPSDRDVECWVGQKNNVGADGTSGVA